MGGGLSRNKAAAANMGEPRISTQSATSDASDTSDGLSRRNSQQRRFSLLGGDPTRNHKQDERVLTILTIGWGGR